MGQKVNDLITLQDNRTWIRRYLLKVLSLNAVDGMRYYEFLINQIDRPVIGKPIKRLVIFYYKHMHTHSVKLPLQDIIAAINQSESVFACPCPCRLLHEENNCGNPLFTCLRLNSFSEITTKIEAKETLRKQGRGNKKSRRLTRAEAVEVVQNARKHGLILSLESCIPPYQNNICACCACCCIELKLRRKIGEALGSAGPYKPTIDPGKCNGCGICTEACPLSAIYMSKMHTAKIEKALCGRCGICAEVCLRHAVILTLDKEGFKQSPPPGFLKWLSVFTFFNALYLVYRGFTLFTKSRQYKYPLATPNRHDVIH